MALEVISRLFDKREMVELLQAQPPSAAIAMLFGGDRFSCCDEFVAVLVGKEIAAIASIAPKGEQGTGTPTIVGLYTVPEFRRKGHGETAFRAAVERCRERGFTTVRVDVMSRHVTRMIEKLPDNDRELLEVHDYGSIMDFMPE